MLKKERKNRKIRVRAKISGSAKRPRISVYRSNKYIYAQLIDDVKGVTLAEVHGVDASKIGADIAKKAKSKKISEAVYDRSGYKYHGKVKALAEAIREGEIKI